MTLGGSLNHRQVEVLRWINDGRPTGRWTNFSFKTVAIALQSRRLVSISKRGGAWTATVLPAGVHYLSHGQYPAGHWGIETRNMPRAADRFVQPRRTIPPMEANRLDRQRLARRMD